MTRDHLILAAIPEAKRIAHKLARRYKGDFDDFESIAMLGLVKAEKQFDETRGVSFIAFAQNHVHGEIIDHLRREGMLPRHTLAKNTR